MKIVLFRPQIPQNTGNILRTCAATASELILIPPLGFQITNRWFKRAGLDYFSHVSFKIVEDFENLFEQNESSLYFFSSHAKRLYTEISYSSDPLLIFGSETEGLPESIWKKWENRFVKIPMQENIRCLNLATTVGIGSYEVIRQRSLQKK